MSIKRKIWALPAISTLIFVLGVGLSAYLAAAALASIRTTEAVDYPVLDSAKSLSLAVGAIGDGLRDAVAEGDKARLQQVQEQAQKLREQIGKLGALTGQGATGERLAAEFEAYFAPALSSARIMLGMQQGDPQDSVARMQKGLATLNDDVARVNEQAQRRFAEGIASSANGVRRTLWVMVGTALVVVAILALVSWLVVRTIWRQLGGEPAQAREIVREIAAGDLSRPIRLQAGDRASLLAVLEEMRTRLADTVSDIKASANTIATASAEIASGNADLASRTESQAMRLDETAREMDKLSVTVQQNSASAQEANRLVDSASGIAARGGDVVGQVVATMGDINQSASKIVDIISVIDGIAFQTNILSLNAAVEAARAGEQGRGFAVVAGEVRTLAQRSASAAKEIKALIGDSVAKVNAGSALVDQAGATMEQIVESVRKVHGIMAEISEAGGRQATGIGQIAKAIGSMDDMTQQNSALVEEASAAASSLAQQAAQLTGALAVFKVASGTAVGKRPAPLALARA